MTLRLKSIVYMEPSDQYEVRFERSGSAEAVVMAFAVVNHGEPMEGLQQPKELSEYLAQGISMHDVTKAVMEFHRARRVELRVGMDTGERD
jgi:hypothetical protein